MSVAASAMFRMNYHNVLRFFSNVFLNEYFEDWDFLEMFYSFLKLLVVAQEICRNMALLFVVDVTYFIFKLCRTDMSHPVR